MEKRFKIFNKKWQSIIMGLFLIIISFSSISLAYNNEVGDKLHLFYTFESPNIQSVEIAGTFYDRITLDYCVPAGNPGEPLIPSKGAYILLPPKSKAYNIQVISYGKQNLGTGYYVEPMEKPIPISSININSIPKPDEKIYNSNSYYPGELYTKVGDYYFRGYQILVLLLHPVQYNPSSGELFYYQTLKVDIELVDDKKTNDLFRGFERDRIEIMKKVDNPEIALSYNIESKSSMNDYDLLILTSDTFKDGFDLLKKSHDENCTSTIIKTLSDIGSSDLDDIRNYIRDAYNNWSIDYVLIGGDSNIIPAPVLWVYGLDEGTDPYETYMPSDLYYACLDGPYNYDGDDKWGEPTDGENGGDVDLFAEVYVGRACVGDISEVNNFVTKTIAYLSRNHDDEYLSNACFAGEYLGDHGVASWGGNYMDQLINGSSADGYTTVGINSSNYDIDTLYDRDYSGHDWPSSEIIDRIENGVHFINHLGHSSYNYNMKLGNNNVDQLTNNDLCFIYSQGCFAGEFDEEDCIAEHFTVKTTNGAFAGIWNARYGFFWSYSTDGDSQRFHREFWDAVFGEDMPELGKANHDSKEDNIPIIGRSMIRWCYYQTNLFGDPSLFFIGAIGNNHPPDIPVSPDGRDYGVPDEEYEFFASTTDPEGDQIFYLFDWGDGEYSGWIGSFESGETASASHTWHELGSYNIRVRARDRWRYASNWSDVKVFPIVENTPPNIPNIYGPSSGKVGKPIEFTIVTTDPDDQDVYYDVFWGNAGSGEVGPFPSGGEQIFGHTWTKAGHFTIKVKAIDTSGAISEIGTFNIRISRNRAVENLLLDRLFQRFPNIFPILRYLLGL